MHIILQTPRLILRQFTEADAPIILALNSDPEIVKYVHEPVLQTEAQAQKILTDIILGRAHIENTASIIVLEKIGMNFMGEGIFDDCPVRTYTKSNTQSV